MKLRDAEELLKYVKQQGPITEPWSVLTDEGIMLEAWPLGFAHGSIGLSEVITMYTRPGYYSQYEGVGEIHKFPKWSPRKMWQQEWFVYLREMQEAFHKVFQGFDRAAFFPRPGEEGNAGAQSATVPMPEDFHLIFSPAREPEAKPFVQWTLEGEQDVSDEELDAIKSAFCRRLKHFCVYKLVDFD